MGRLEWSTIWKVLLVAAFIAWLIFVLAPKIDGNSGSDCPASAYPENC